MLTVNGLVAARNDLALVAGAEGGERIITWAHVCDLPDPWAWVGPGDLVMTTGDGLPSDPAEQLGWMARLVDAGIGGLLLALRPGLPPASAELLARADELNTPVLLADFSIEFVTVSRTVIESAVRSERDHINVARRLFDVYSGALLARRDLSGRLDLLARSLGWTIAVARRDGGGDLAGGGRPRPEVEPITVTVPGRVPVDLCVWPDRARMLDGALVQYLAGLVGIELELQVQEHADRQQRGELVLRGVLDASISPAQLLHELASRGLRDTSLVLAVFPAAATAPGRSEVDDFFTRDAKAQPLVAAVGEDLVVLAPAEWPGLRLFLRRLSEAVPAGVSSPVAPGVPLSEALLQARLAARRAGEAGQPFVRYDQLEDVGGGGPRSLVDLRNLLQRVLGAVIEHDRTTGGELLRTLDLFLRNDRSWTRTADDLGVHRQTLVYRIAQVERLTGVKPTSTRGIATLWAALEAARVLGDLSP